MDSRLTHISKEISYALRHAPWEYELELDEQGFVPIEQLLQAMNEGRDEGDAVALTDLERIVAESDKQRHEIDGGRIRALYGHSVPKRIERLAAEPPAVLYHGTSHEAARRILAEGLRPMGRQYVHLSCDVETAEAVGKRRDRSPIILAIDTKRADGDGVAFYRGNDKVWLADSIPADCISVRKGSPYGRPSRQLTAEPADQRPRIPSSGHTARPEATHQA